MAKLEVTPIYSCECGWHGVKKFLVPETYENETLINCPKCYSVVYVELTKKEFDRRWFEQVKNGSKQDIASFLRKTKVRGT